jgi:hypothetical protein
MISINAKPTIISKENNTKQNDFKFHKSRQISRPWASKKAPTEKKEASGSSQSTAFFFGVENIIVKCEAYDDEWSASFKFHFYWRSQKSLLWCASERLIEFNSFVMHVCVCALSLMVMKWNDLLRKTKINLEFTTISLFISSFDKFEWVKTILI